MKYLTTATLVFFLTCLASSIQAYCIYNDSADNSFFIRQMPLNSGGTYNSRFRRESLGPGDKACCNYTNTDCNKNGNPDDIIIMAFQSILDGKGKNFMFTVTMTAGGYIELGGDGLSDPVIHVFNADGTPSKFEYQVSPRGIMLN